MAKDSKFLECGCGTLVDKKSHQNKHCPICGQKYSKKDQLPDNILSDLAQTLNRQLNSYNPEDWDGMLYGTDFKVDSLTSDKRELTIMLSSGKKRRKMVLKIESFTDAKDDNE